MPTRKTATRELDLLTGLQLNRKRYYHQQLGTWLSRDPIGYLGGLNLYGYVVSRPTFYVDPTGLQGDFGIQGWCESLIGDPSRFCPKPKPKPPWFNHYWDNSGTPIDLGDYDLLDDFQRDDDVRNCVRKHKKRISNSDPNPCEGKQPGETASVTVTVTDTCRGIQLEDSIFVLGNTTLQIVTTCTFTGECYKPCIDNQTDQPDPDIMDTKGMTYDCETTYRIVDRFSDPWDVIDIFPGEWNPDGTPYPITGGWDEEWGTGRR
ncbi:RHS repeat-associated core domain-containing protein [Posidoniimonas corsicana]|nr:RHS repeat-associated core domain-containing protein [Posidoniimonas corsicana]